MSVDDLEPVDFEPIDLEPIDLRGEDSGEYPDREPSRFRGAWVAVAGIVVLAVGWIGIGAMSENDHAEETTALTLPSSTTTGVGLAPLEERQPITERTVAVLVDALDDVGTGRFAAIVDDQLYVIDARTDDVHRADALGRWPAVEARSGSSLLVRTRTGYALFDTERHAVTDLQDYRFAIPAAVRDRWWLVDHAGLLIDSAFGRDRPVPEGLRLVAEFDGEFLGLTEQGYARWDGTGSPSPLAIDGSVLSVGPRGIVTRTNCTASSCEISVTRPEALGPGLQDPHFLIAGVTHGAGLSASGARLALTSTRSEVTVLDVGNGSVLFRAHGRSLGEPASAFSWTTNTDELLVVEQNNLAIWRGPTLTPRTVVGVPGLQQIVALP